MKTQIERLITEAVIKLDVGLLNEAYEDMLEGVESFKIGAWDHRVLNLMFDAAHETIEQREG